MSGLDPESGGTIDEFHELAAVEFANLNIEFANQQNIESDDAGMDEGVRESEKIVEPGPASHGSGDGESVSESQT